MAKELTAMMGIAAQLGSDSAIDTLLQQLGIAEHRG
jgi:hypothetical protein